MDFDKKDSNKASVTHTVTEDGIYKIQVVAYNSRRGPFTVTIREGGVPAGKAVKVDPKIYEVAADGLTIKSELTAADGRDVKFPKSAARTFQVKLEAKQKYVIDMKSTVIDSFLRLDDPKGNQIAQDDDSGGFPNARILYTPKEDGTYRITTLTFDGRFGEFALDGAQGMT